MKRRTSGTYAQGQRLMSAVKSCSLPAIVLLSFSLSSCWHVRGWRWSKGSEGQTDRSPSLVQGATATTRPLAAKAPPTLNPSSLQEMQLGLPGIAYWEGPYFANALFHEDRNWRDRATGKKILRSSPQLNENGYPRYLESGQVLIATPGQNMGKGRNGLLRGRVALTWEGEADIRLSNGNLVRGTPAGMELNGRREYDFNGSGLGLQTEIHAVNPDKPLTKVRLWLPDPKDPLNKSLEPQPGSKEPIFHPVFLERVKPFKVIRFMAWLATNGSPEQDWQDRRLPTDAFAIGVINPRSPANDAKGNPYGGNSQTGVPWEFVVALGNATGRDIWINIPHRATDDYVRKVAQLIRFGSNGKQPYPSAVQNPTYPPLRSGLRVFVEYSNEIWAPNSGGFPQGDYALEQAKQRNLKGRAEFNAQRASEIWRIFQDVFGGTGRIVRVAGAWTGAGNTGENYTRSFLNEAFSYGSPLGVRPDVLAVTTYFGQIKNYVFNEKLYENLSQENLNKAFDVWEQLMLSGVNVMSGQDSVGSLGGFGLKNRQIALDFSLPIIAYEGGPSLDTGSIVCVGADGRLKSDSNPCVKWGEMDRLGGQGKITDFLEAMGRHPRIEKIYELHLNLAKMLGLRSHAAFVLSSKWDKYGQWGHLEYLDQPVAPKEAGYSPKYHFLLSWMEGQKQIRPIDDPKGARPSFVTEGVLPPAVVGLKYSTKISAKGGDGSLKLLIVGGKAPDGMGFRNLGSSLVLEGTPSKPGEYRFFARVTDENGDPAWKIFSVTVNGQKN